ncbi:MAG: formylglycine-generating enzyme family protein [Rhodobacteraceae bacterium]|nr:formylglycine-generating enzyme family protein [Paracoccaceae bacterium]
MEFVWIEGGTFWMGCGEQETECSSDEKPRHQVTVNGFWMGRTEVTNAQYRQFIPKHDSQDFKGHSLNADEQPVVYVSWEEATNFIDWLTKSNKGKDEFRLPTEAEWEYAARAGTTTARYWGDNPDDACQYANVADETAKKEMSDWTIHNCDDGYAVSAPVGSFRPNAFGLYDMLGNVWEWVADPWHDNYEGAPSNAKVWEEGDANLRLLRGGSWGSDPQWVRCALRLRYSFVVRLDGFRVVRAAGRQ